jgi:hypothetical protein
MPQSEFRRRTDRPTGPPSVPIVVRVRLTGSGWDPLYQMLCRVREANDRAGLQDTVIVLEGISGTIELVMLESGAPK